MTRASRAALRAIVVGLYLLVGESPAQSQLLVRNSVDVGIVNKIVPFGDEIWLATSNGVFRVDRKGNPAVAIKGLLIRNRDVFLIVHTADETWFASSAGAYRVDRSSNQAMPVEGPRDEVGLIVPLGDEVWLGAADGAFRVDRKGNQAVRVDGQTGDVDSIVSVGNEIWLGGTRGLFRVDRKRNQAVPVGGITGLVYSIIPVGDEVWLATSNGAFRMDRKRNRAVPLGGRTGIVDSIVPVGDEVWLAAAYGAFRVDRKGNQAVRVEGYKDYVYSIFPVSDEIWLGPQKGGAFRVDRKRNQAVPVGGITGLVYSIIPVGNEVWLGTADGIFRVDRKSNQAVPLSRLIGVDSIVSVGDEIWLGAADGLFRVDRSTKISVDLDGSLQGVARLLGTEAWFQGATRPVVQYLDTETRKQNYGGSQSAPIKLVYDSDLAELLKKEKNLDKWAPVTQDGPLIDLKPGWSKIYFAVRDGWGNEPEPQIVEGWVIPTWTLSFLLPVLSIGFCLVCFGLAPYVRYCQMLLMNPFLRNWVSFGTIPLLLTAVPPLREHIFRRYCRELAEADRFQSFAGRYVIPEERFAASEFAGFLAQHRVVGFHGQSGIGKSAFLTYLAYQCASREAAHPLLRRLVPVFVDLSIVGHLPPEVMVRSDLRKYGDLTDEKLTDVLLDQGGFLFLFDGLNEVSDAARHSIVQFADMHRNHNYACLATQVATEELKRVATLVEGNPLSDEKVKELVRKVSKDADVLLAQFDGEMFAICRVPFQLELAVEIWEASGALPRNLDGLYFHVLGPLVDKEVWAARGHGEWPDVLSALAFTMMTGKRPYNTQNDYLPEELKTELVSRKLLVERGEAMEFRHDRIRAYLAAKYFRLRWRTILTDGKTIVDPNWDVMLQFHLMVEQNENQTRDLLFLLVKRDMDAAIRLSSWGRQNRPELFENWQDDFNREIGRRVIGDPEKTGT